MSSTSNPFDLSEKEKEAVIYLKKQFKKIEEELVKYLLSKSKKSNIQEAITCTRLAVAASKYLNDEWLYAVSTFELASLYLTVEERKKALFLYEDIYEIFKKHGDPQYVAALSGNLGTIYCDEGNPERALACFHDALTIYEQLTLKKEQAYCHISIGNVHYLSGTLDKAQQSYQTALQISNALKDEQGKAEAHASLGNALSDMGDLTNAETHYRTALSIYEGLNLLPGIATLCTNLGTLYTDLGRIDEARTYYEKALEINKMLNRKQATATTYVNLGNLYSRLGHYEKAAVYYRDAQELCQMIDFEHGAAGAYTGMGLLYMDRGMPYKALEFHKTALKISKKIQHLQGEASNYTNIGLCFAELGDFKKSIAYYQKSLRIYKKIHCKGGEASVYGNMGLAYAELGQREKALALHKKSLNICQQIGYLQGQASAHMNMGITLQDAGELEQALTHFEAALRIDSHIQYTYGEASAYMNMGNVYYDLAELEKALQFHKKAFMIHQKMGFKRGKASDLGNIANVYLRMGEEQKAAQKFEEALKIFQQIQLPQLEASTYTNLGAIYHGWGDFEKALSCYEKALLLHRQIGYREGEASTYNNLGRLYYTMEEYSKAEEYYNKGLDIARVFGLSHIEQRLYMGLGELHEQLHEVESALEYYRRSAALYEIIKQKSGSEEVMSRFFLGNKDIYGLLTNLLLKCGCTKEAFTYIEKAKSAVLSERLSKREVTHKHHDTLFQKEWELENLINTLRGESLYSGKPYESVSEQLEQYHKTLKEVRTHIAHKYPELTDFHPETSIVLEELQKFLDTNTAIMEYFIFRGDLLVFIIFKDAIHYECIDKPAITETLVENIPLSMLTGLKTLTPVAALCDKYFSDGQLLYIIPHGFLHYVPFHALRTSQWLIEKYKIVYAPSATILQYCLGFKSQPDNWLVMGDPKGEFVFSREEAEEVSKIVGSNALTSQKATWETFVDKSPKVKGIHLACHGIFVPDNPMASFVEFADKCATARDIFGLELNADLVVLSACETGMCTLRFGDEIMGLTRAFLAAGVKSLVHSLWPVYGVSSKRLMVQFYNNLLCGLSKVDSLRNAQLDTLCSTRFNNPFYWAPFVLVGDWR